jgi:hypothetical protein
MSRALDLAEAMAARLNDEPALYLAGFETLVDRQKDLTFAVDAQLAKNAGGCIIITYDGFTNPDKRPTPTPVVTRNYSVRVIARPILRGPDEMPADDICELAARALQNSQPEGAATLIRVGAATLTSDATYLVYLLTVEVESRL